MSFALRMRSLRYDLWLTSIQCAQPLRAEFSRWTKFDPQFSRWTKFDPRFSPWTKPPTKYSPWTV